MRLAVSALLLGACATHHPQVTYTELQSQAEQRPMTYATYTPPGWDGETPLPLVVFLHGGGDDHTVLDKHAVVPRTFDRWIEDGLLPPFVMVAPNGDRGFWRNWHDGTHRYADWVLDEVITDVRTRLPLLEEPEHQHLMGISMGGAGTLYMGLENLDRFASFTVWSAPIFDVDQVVQFLSSNMLQRFGPFAQIFGPPDREKIEQDNAFARLQEAADLRGTRLMIGAGTVDIGRLLKTTKLYHEHLEERGVPHDFVIYKGGHRWVDWARVFPVALCRHMLAEDCELPKSSFYKLESVTTDDAVGDAD
jgi:enterochelin esterase-like enzyme